MPEINLPITWLSDTPEYVMIVILQETHFQQLISLMVLDSLALVQSLSLQQTC